MQNKIDINLQDVTAAAFMEMCHVIKLRLIEAVFIFKWLPEGGKPSGLKTFWPDFEREYKAPQKKRYYPKPDEISRCNQVFDTWLPFYVDREEAEALLSYAKSIAFPKLYGSVRELCRLQQQSRRIYDRRLTLHIQALARSVCKSDKSLRFPKWSLVVPMLRNQTIEIDKMASVVGWISEGAMPVLNFYERNGESAAP